jgi:hypothetical protein
VADIELRAESEGAVMGHEEIDAASNLQRWIVLVILSSGHLVIWSLD